jgi:uncharacterized membrane protein
MSYTLDQWVLFFFFYCLCGWIWESCYVSARQHRWVNRGFLHGPLLPIYGSGAVIVLLATLRVQGSLPLIALLGLLAATVLEYCTGAAMERLFKVRYWDYSTQKCNLNGYVCLSSTLAWGVFSVLLVKVIHPPVAWLILRIPAVWSEPLVFVLVAGTTVDAVQSVRAALDLREILTKLTEENEDLRRLAKRAEVISAFAGDDLRRFRERTEIGRLLFSEQVEGERARIQEERGLHTLRREEQLDRLLSRRADARISALQTVSQTLQRALAELDERKELTGEALRARKQELTEALERLRDQEARVRTRTVRTYAQALRILQGNPSASAGRFSEALESLRNLAGSLKK